MTADASVKLAPVIVIWLPPATGPLFGLRLATLGVATNVNSKEVLCALVPPGPVTVT